MSVSVLVLFKDSYTRMGSHLPGIVLSISKVLLVGVYCLSLSVLVKRKSLLSEHNFICIAGTNRALLDQILELYEHEKKKPANNARSVQQGCLQQGKI